MLEPVDVDEMRQARRPRQLVTRKRRGDLGSQARSIRERSIHQAIWRAPFLRVNFALRQTTDKLGLPTAPCAGLAPTARQSSGGASNLTILREPLESAGRSAVSRRPADDRRWNFHPPRPTGKSSQRTVITDL